MINVKVLKTKGEYTHAVKRTMEIFHAEEGTSEADELDLLLVLVKDYEDKNIQLPAVDPIEAIKLKMEEKGMKPKDLEPAIGTKGHVSAILSGKREITLSMARRLKNLLHLPAETFLNSQ